MCVCMCLCVSEKEREIQRLRPKFTYIKFHAVRFGPSLQMLEFLVLAFVNLNSIIHGFLSTPKIMLTCKFDEHSFLSSSKSPTNNDKLDKTEPFGLPLEIIL